MLDAMIQGTPSVPGTEPTNRLTPQPSGLRSSQWPFAFDWPFLVCSYTFCKTLSNSIFFITYMIGATY